MIQIGFVRTTTACNLQPLSIGFSGTKMLSQGCRLGKSSVVGLPLTSAPAMLDQQARPHNRLCSQRSQGADVCLTLSEQWYESMRKKSRWQDGMRR